jgi:integrase
MASISRQANGRKMIQFSGADGQRRSIRLGKVSLASAQAVKLKVENLVAASITGHAVDDETARWVAKLDDVMRDRLAAVGLVPKREAATLGAFIDAYIDGRSDVKASTRIVFEQTRGYLVKYFGSNKLLRDVTPGDADEWRLWLIGTKKLADNTVRRRCGVAKQFFRAAVRKGLIPSNPLAELVAAVQGNPKREYFVTREQTEKILKACPDAEWRLLFALCRYGGLRCPTEVLGLRWVDVDWERSRFTVHSPKTEHHPGRDRRVVPLFPELLPYLRDGFEQAPEGSEYVIMRYRKRNTNLRTQLMRIIERAGLTPWPKLFQNLRSTRQTELEDRFPSHVVCAWMGNSRPIAAKHYLQVTAEHFERAASGDGEALQNAMQHRRAPECTAGNDPEAQTEKQAVFAGVRDDAESFNGGKMGELGDTGLEPVTSCMSSKRSSQLS